ncbi:MAG: CpsD/CapB family tyrosine-protein kinase, partial [Solirubrobacteraceae bacterium]
IFGLPLVGIVPESSVRGGGRSARVPRRNSSAVAVADSFRFIRARLRYFNIDRDLRALAVVSALPGDGKTTITHWLADATAATGAHVLVIESDLRRPTLAEKLGVKSGPGLADVLIATRRLEDVAQRVPLATLDSEEASERGFDVIVAGALPPNPAEMLESHAMTMLLDQAREAYDLVLLDTTPLGLSDALPLLRRVDGITVVASVGRSRRDVSNRVRATLTSLDAPLLGVIANRVRVRSHTLYGYGYGYRHRAGHGPASPADVAGRTNGSVPAGPVAAEGVELPT